MKEISQTTSTSKYDDFILQEIVDFIYNATNEEEAVHNAKIILESHERKLSFWKLLKLMFNK